MDLPQLRIELQALDPRRRRFHVGGTIHALIDEYGDLAIDFHDPAPAVTGVHRSPQFRLDFFQQTAITGNGALILSQSEGVSVAGSELDGGFIGGGLSKPGADVRSVTDNCLDANPVVAGLARTPQDYPHCSARHYGRRFGPDWLTRTWVEREVVENRAVQRYDPSRYPGVFSPSLPEATRRVIEADIESRDCSRQDIDLLLEIGQAEFAEWLHRRAMLADGSRALRPLVAAETILAGVRSTHPDPPRRAGRGAWSDCDLGLLGALLLRTLGGQRIRDVAGLLGCSPATASRLWTTARQRIETDESFATTAAALARTATRAFWESR